jgi:WhiB family redox-sensing transcriptional regulator
VNQVNPAPASTIGRPSDVEVLLGIDRELVEGFDVFVRRESSLPETAPVRLGYELRALELDDVDDEGGALSWQERALCAQTDPEAFFPEKGGSTREAKKVCVSCEVRSECLDYALAHDERFGIWGGLSERERRRLKRQAV